MFHSMEISEYLVKTQVENPPSEIISPHSMLWGRPLEKISLHGEKMLKIQSWTLQCLLRVYNLMLISHTQQLQTQL